MDQAEEVAYVVRKFDEIAKTPKTNPKPRRGLLVPALFLITLIVIIVVAYLYVRKNGVPQVKNPFAKKSVSEKPATLVNSAPNAIQNGSPMSAPVNGSK